MKSDRGAITLYVSAVCLFVMIAGIAGYILSINKQVAQNEQLNQIEKEYAGEQTQDEIYNQYIGGEVIPVYTADQLMKMGSGEDIYIDGKVYKYSTGKTYSIQNDITTTGNYSNISNLIKNNQIIIEGNKHKITVQDGNGGEKYYTEASKYYIATNKYGYVIDGLQLLYDGIDNSGTGVHNSNATIWKDLSGNGKDGTIELNGKTIQNTEVKEEYGATWIKVLHHKTNSATTLFSSESEALNCNSADKYSILSSLESFRNTNGEFEFLLEYPGQSGYNRWKQTSNPTTTQESVTGYQAVAISWTGDYWGGICKSSTSNTFLDGSVNHSNWWYALGSYSAYQGGMPGPSSVIVDEVYLWARIDNVVNSEPEIGKPINNLEIKQAYNATWLKVLYHKTHSGTTLFTSEAEALSCNSSYKYSLLNKLENYRNTNGEFEFLLEYPGQSGYNRWKQTSNPTTTQESVTGYQAVNISWTDNVWGGLCKSSSSETFIDGSVGHGNWFYAIGAYASWNEGIPSAAAVTDEVYLWVRVDNIGKSGWQENGLKFDGINDSVLIGQMNYNNVTLETVVQFNSISDDQDSMCIVSNYQAGGYGLSMYKKLFFEMYSSTNGRYEQYGYNNYLPEVNKKYSISGSYNGSSVSYRENGSKNTNVTAGALKQTTSNTILALGGNPESNYTNQGYLDGTIYSVRVYNRALTEDEAQTNYLADKVRYET